jgi:hypothetical protein
MVALFSSLYGILSSLSNVSQLRDIFSILRLLHANGYRILNFFLTRFQIFKVNFQKRQKLRIMKI